MAATIRAAIVLTILILGGCGTSPLRAAPTPTAARGGEVTHPSTGAHRIAPPPAPTTGPVRSFGPTGSFKVAVITLSVVDPTRPTVSYGQVVATSRTLTTRVWYPPIARGPYPLIIFAPGFEVGLTPYTRICRAWASAGYVVAAPEFPLTDEAVAGRYLDEHDMVNQPRDVSVVISAILGRSDSVAPSPLRDLVKADAIAVAGHSDGADTALAAGFLPGDLDSRLRAVAADAPDAFPEVSPSAPLHSSTPLLLIHGTADPIAPFAGSVRVTEQLKTRGWFVELLGAGHLPPIEGPSPWTTLFDDVTTAFFNQALKGAPVGAVIAAVEPPAAGHLVVLPEPG